MECFKSIRVEKKLTQQQVAEQVLKIMNPVDEMHGILCLDDIRKKCSKVFSDKDVEFCYLFGSYAKDRATQTSDVDLLVATKIGGLKYFALIEEIRIALHKKVDVLDFNQLKDNPELVYEILKDGIKIYG